MHRSLVLVCLSFIWLQSLQAEEEKSPDVIPPYLADIEILPDEPSGIEVPVRQDGKIVLEVIPKDEPFLTGPLLCPSAHTIPYGHMNLETYVFFNNNLGYYNNHWQLQTFATPRDNINFQYLIQVGLSAFQDFSIVPQVFYNYTGRYHKTVYGDLTFLTAFQLHTSTFDSWIPTIKFEISETFPTGKYDQLEALDLGTDVGGAGAFGTGFKFVASDLWYFGNHHFLAFRASLGAVVFSNVRVKGANAYGGDPTTDGIVSPGSAFTFITAGEFTFTKHWAIACDMAMTYALPTTFKGNTIAFVGQNQGSYILSFAPAIEYNFNANVGIIGGIWLSAIGYNASDFINGVFALNWYFP